MPLAFFKIVLNVVKFYNATPHQLHFFRIVFIEIVVDLCSLLTTYTLFSMVLTNSPTYSHDFTKKIIHCVYPGRVKPYM